MIVTCGDCGRKYKIDPEKITGEQARFTCKGCSATVTVNKQASVAEENPGLDESTLSALQEEGGGGDSEETAEPVAKQPTTAPETGEQEFGKRKGLGLTAKVILLMLLASLLPLAVYFALSFTETSNHIKDETTNSGMRTSTILAEQVDEWIDKNTRVLQTLAELPGMNFMNMYEQETLLKSLQREYPWIYLAFTTDNIGLNTARSDGKELKNYSDRQYVKDITVNGKELAWQTLIGKTSGKPALVLSAPIIKGGDKVGVLASAMTREAISQIVTNYKQGETGSVFLVDESGKVVAHQNYEYVTGQKDFTNHPLVKAGRNKVSGMVEFKGEDQEDLIGFAHQTALGWTLAVQQDKAEAFEALTNSQRYAYTLLAITFVVILIIAYLSSRAIVTPIRNLTDAANRISVGDLGVNIVNTSKDEIGDLADAITRMQDSIKLSISRLKKRRR